MMLWSSDILKSSYPSYNKWTHRCNNPLDSSSWEILAFGLVHQSHPQMTKVKGHSLEKSLSCVSPILRELCMKKKYAEWRRVYEATLNSYKNIYTCGLKSAQINSEQLQPKCTQETCNAEVMNSYEILKKEKKYWVNICWNQPLLKRLKYPRPEKQTKTFCCLSLYNFIPGADWKQTDNQRPGAAVKRVFHEPVSFLSSSLHNAQNPYWTLLESKTL